LNLLLGMNKEKVIYYQQYGWLSGTTSFNVSTVPASNHRSELLADNIESTKLAENSNWRI